MSQAAPSARPAYQTLQGLVAAFALLHNGEEALAMPHHASLVRERLSGFVPAEPLALTANLSWFYAALLIVTVIPALLVATALSAPSSRLAARAVVFVQSMFLVNVVVPHVPAMILLGGYAPGVVTAVAIQLPFSLYFLRRSVREGVVSAAGAWLTVLLAVPGLLLVFGALSWIACR